TRLLRERFHDARFECSAHICSQTRQRRRRLHQFLSNQLSYVSGEWGTSAQHVVSDCSQRIDVSASIEWQSRLHLFGGHVFWCANDSSGGRSAGGSIFRTIGADDLCQAKVTDLYEPIFCGRTSSLLHQKNVCWFQIAVKNSFIMRGFDSGNNLPHDVYRTLRIDRSLAS